MKVIVLLALIAYAVADPDMSDPHAATAAIEHAADDEYNQIESKLDGIQKTADKAEEQLKVNMKFAKGVAQDVKGTVNIFDKIDKEELSSIKDAAEMKQDAVEMESGTDTLADIESADEDAAKLSEKIDSDAKQADSELQGEIQKLKGAGVGKVHHNRKQAKKQTAAAELGEAEVGKQEPNWLADAEEKGESKVNKAKSDVADVKQAAQNAKDEVTELSKKVADGLSQLEASEQRLHQDINGHKDLDLEKDMRAKAADIEDLEAAAKTSEPLEASSPEEAAQQAYNEEPPEPPASAGPDGPGSQADFFSMGDDNNAELGETRSLEDTIHMAEEAAAHPKPEAPEVQELGPGDEPPEPPMDREIDSPTDGAPSGGIKADLKAIENDAKQLEDYQQATIKEVDMIADPLKQ